MSVYQIPKLQQNKILYTRIVTTKYHTPISKNVVGENGEWQLSNGDCTTERIRGFYIWYAKTMSSSRGAKLMLPCERQTGPGLT